MFQDKKDLNISGQMFLWYVILFEAFQKPYARPPLVQKPYGGCIPVKKGTKGDQKKTPNIEKPDFMGNHRTVPPDFT